MIVFAANVMALVGLPSLFVLLEGMRDRFVHLNLGLAAVLVLTGVEMATAEPLPPAGRATLSAVVGADRRHRCSRRSRPDGADRPPTQRSRRNHADLV